MAATVATWNKGKAPAGDTGWQLTPDVRAGLESMNVIVPVADQAERDGLTPPLGKYPGMAVARMDLGALIEVWDGSAWQRGNSAAAPTTSGGWTLTGSLVRTISTAGKQVSSAFRAIYGGGTFTLNSDFTPAFTLTNAGYLPVGNDAYGYFMLRASGTRVIKADCTFTINPAGEVYVRTLIGQAATTVAAGDELSFNTVWNA